MSHSIVSNQGKRLSNASILHIQQNITEATASNFLQHWNLPTRLEQEISDEYYGLPFKALFFKTVMSIILVIKHF